MFNLGFSEIVIIGIIALIFIGPKELPEIARVIGRLLNELKRAASDLQTTISTPQDKIREEINKLMEPIAGDKNYDPNKFQAPPVAKNDGEEKK